MNRYLIDTNVISEPTHLKPDPGVVAWLQATPANRHCISAITIGEIIKGVIRTADETKRRFLAAWVETLIHDFEGRILPVDTPVALVFGDILGNRKTTPPLLDSLIAATAIAHGLTLVTRNARDFDFRELKVFNPWNAS